MKSIISLFVGTWFLVAVLSQEIMDGTCSQFGVSNVQPFFKKLMMGNWYLYATYGYPDIDEFDCVKFVDQLTADGNARTIELARNLATNALRVQQSLMIFDQPGVGHYIYQLPSEGISENTRIISTDYTHYYIEFVCNDVNGQSSSYLGIFTRLPIPDVKTLTRINLFLNAHPQFDRSKLRFVVQHIRCLV